jgi:hypothetical protein
MKGSACPSVKGALSRARSRVESGLSRNGIATLCEEHPKRAGGFGERCWIELFGEETSLSVGGGWGGSQAKPSVKKVFHV